MRKSRSRKQVSRTYTESDIRYIQKRLGGGPIFWLRGDIFYNKLATHFGVSRKAIYNKIARLENRWSEADRY